MPHLPGVVHFLLLLALCFALSQAARRSPLAGWLLPALGVKWLAWIVFLFLSASRTVFAPDGEEMFAAAGVLIDHWQGLVSLEAVPFYAEPRAFFAVKLLVPFYWLSGGDLVMAGLYLGLLSTAGLFWAAHSLVVSYSLPKWAVGLAFFLWPSVVFWGGMVGKEAFALGLIGVFVGAFVPVYANKATGLLWRIPLMVVSLWALFELKFYYAVPLGACAAALLMADPVIKRWAKRPWQGHVIFVLILIGLAGMAGLVHPQLKLDVLLHSIYRNYLATLNATDHPHWVPIDIDTFRPTAGSFLAHLPEATGYGLFGPLPQHAYKKIVVVASFENTLLLSLCVCALIGWIRTGLRFTLEGHAVLWLILMMAPILAMSSPNWGTLVRYKVGFLPWLVLLAAWGTDRYLRSSRSQSTKNK